jgi:hypothetical protein
LPLECATDVGSTSLLLGHYRSASTLPLIAINAWVITTPNFSNVKKFKNSFIKVSLCYVWGRIGWCWVRSF